MKHNILILIISLILLTIALVSNCTTAGAEFLLIRYWTAEEEYDDAGGKNHLFDIAYEFFSDDTGKYRCSETIRDSNHQITSEALVEKSDLIITDADSFNKTITIKY